MRPPSNSRRRSTAVASCRIEAIPGFRDTRRLHAGYVFVVRQLIVISLSNPSHVYTCGSRQMLLVGSDKWEISLEISLGSGLNKWLTMKKMGWNHLDFSALTPAFSPEITQVKQEGHS